ncbi:coatomer subunit delta [Anaeramoeba ignava]|uniref:Coatomer subunit delta n=1 Tax=Anaeramoeba ignava TaxID=1746090 RepID=A0A9Q0LIF4_ANAIG|nr:coatomer subunit delta [Anaeramoeba ignava]
MVVLAAAICTKKGKVLLSRQFVSITRGRIEGLLSVFPKLMGTGKQHTFVETENIRYVYQPIENLILLILTTKSSNILEDMETLRILAQLVPEYCPKISESEIEKRGFDLIFAFDEVIALGYKEKASLSQIKTYLSMESFNEKRFQEIQEEKERLAKEKMAEKMRQIEIAKEEAERTGAQLFGSRGVFRGGFGNDTEETGPTNYTMEMEKHISTDPPMITTRAYNNTNTNMQKSQNQPEKKIPSKGMKLVVQKQSNILAALKDEGEIEEFEKPQIQQQQENEPNTLEQEQQNQPDFPRKDVHFDVYEILTATLSKDGGLQNMEVSGSLDLFITNKDKTPLVIKLSKEKNPEKMIFRTHPHINKNLFQSENTLVLKDNSKPFPANGSQIPVLKWKWDNSDFTKIPLFLNCWPTNSGDTTSVNVEYSLEQKSFELHDVVALIPVPQSPVIEEVVGNYSYDHKQKILTWEIPLIDSSNQSGTIEFTIPKCNHSSLFPILLKFKSPNIYANLSVDSVLVVKDEEQNPTEFSQRQLLSTSSFSIN